MQRSDYQAFVATLSGIGDMRNKPPSPATIAVWWKVLAAYDWPAVEDALMRHLQNPDNGQYMPQPADVIRLMEGSTLDRALLAWSKVEQTVRGIGPWYDVVFDDALIHRVIEDLGSWTWLCDRQDKDWPFVGKEFQNRYRGYLTRSDLKGYQGVLLGWCNEAARRLGQKPILVGDARMAVQVARGGGTAHTLGFQFAGDAVLDRLPAPAAKQLPAPAKARPMAQLEGQLA